MRHTILIIVLAIAVHGNGIRLGGTTGGACRAGRAIRFGRAARAPAG